MLYCLHNKKASFGGLITSVWEEMADCSFIDYMYVVGVIQCLFEAVSRPLGCII